MNYGWLENLIAEYLHAVHSLAQRLATSFGQIDLLEGRRNLAVPRTGEVAGGLQFQFHGIGCWISDGDESVDFDFLPDGSLGGFDAWRLRLFESDNSSSAGPRSQEEIQSGLNELARRGLVQPVEGSRLYRRNPVRDDVQGRGDLASGGAAAGCRGKGHPCD